jgi:hypothetical protein
VYSSSPIVVTDRTFSQGRAADRRVVDLQFLNEKNLNMPVWFFTVVAPLDGKSLPVRNYPRRFPNEIPITKLYHKFIQEQ